MNDEIPIWGGCSAGRGQGNTHEPSDHDKSPSTEHRFDEWRLLVLSPEARRVVGHVTEHVCKALSPYLGANPALELEVGPGISFGWHAKREPRSGREEMSEIRYN
jgi:hypothetical protein